MYSMMPDTMPLFDYPAPFREPTIEDRFLMFHRANPDVYRRLRDMARQLKAKNRKHYGIKSLVEVLRWEHDISTTDVDFKINNNHAPYYARMIMDRCDDLKGFFSVRELTSERNGT